MFNFFKRNRREINAENQCRGKQGEESVKSNYESRGYKVKRTGKGHDYKVSKRDLFTGKKESKYVEVKTGNSKLSKLQKKKKARLGSRYVVERPDNTGFRFCLPKISLFGVSSSKESKKKNKKSDPFGMSSTSLFGVSSSKKSKKKKQSDPFGMSSSSSLFGGTTKKSKRKRKSNQSDNFWF